LHNREKSKDLIHLKKISDTSKVFIMMEESENQFSFGIGWEALRVGMDEKWVIKAKDCRFPLNRQPLLFILLEL